MESGLITATTSSSLHIFFNSRPPPPPGHKYLINPHTSLRNSIRISSLTLTAAAAAPRKGGGVLDRPTVDKSNPGRQSEFDLRKSMKTSPPYRVLLHNDSFNKREYVVQVLMKVIPGMTVDIAVNVMQEAHINGMAVATICAQVDAEDHCMQLRGNGLMSSVEPAGGGC